MMQLVLVSMDRPGIPSTGDRTRTGSELPDERADALTSVNHPLPVHNLDEFDLVPAGSLRCLFQPQELPSKGV